MTDRRDNDAPIGVAGLEGAGTGTGPGAMLRAAREKRGLHIAALAASIKVSPRKLEALEADRFDELPDMTFTRALALTVCRALKVDAGPVLSRLPQAGDMSNLAQVGGGLNAPFRMAPGRRDPADFTFHRRPAFWATLVVLAGALALALLPERWMPWRSARTPSSPPTSPAAALAPAAARPVSSSAESAAVAAVIARPLPTVAAVPAASLPSPAASVMVETVHSAPLPSVSGTESAVATAGVLAVRTRAESWVEVQDGRGQMLLSRTVQPGETVGLDGALPLRLTIGNAAGTQVSFRGQPVDLASSTRDNIARLQLPPR